MNVEVRKTPGKGWRVTFSGGLRFENGGETILEGTAVYSEEDAPPSENSIAQEGVRSKGESVRTVR